MKLNLLSKSIKPIIGLVMVLTANQLFAQCYAQPEYCKNIATATFVSGSYGITSVTLGTATNATAIGSGSQVYFDYTDNANIGSATPGNVIPFSVTVGAVANQSIKIWVDWNRDGVFNTTGTEAAYSSAVIASGGTVTGNITVPVTSTVGLYRCRVSVDAISTPAGPAHTPCSKNYAADVEDYTIAVRNTGGDDAAVGKMMTPALAVNSAITPSPSHSFYFRNMSSLTVNSISIGYQINGTGTIVTETKTGLSVAAGDSAIVTFSGANNLSVGNGLVAGQMNNVKSWIYSVNGGANLSTGNDTLCWSFYYGAANSINGNYTIDRTAIGIRNFPSFLHATTALTTIGVNAATMINVVAGTYTENVNIGLIPGASIANNVTFQGASNTTCIISPPFSSAINAAVRFSADSFVTVRNFKIFSQQHLKGTSILVHFLNASRCNVRNCNIEYGGVGAGIGTGSIPFSTSANYGGVVISGTANSFTSTSANAENNNIDSNNIKYGYYGITCNLTSGNRVNSFTMNNIDSVYYYGAYFSSSQTIKFRNNVVTTRISNAAAIGLYAINASTLGTNFHEISGNKIYGRQYGLYMLTANGTLAAPGRMFNNFIGGGFISTVPYAIYTTSSNWNIYHNSINVNAPNVTSSPIGAIHIATGASGNVDLRNNNIVVTSPTSSTGIVPLYVATATSCSSLDYNNYFNTANANLVNIAGTAKTSLNYKVAYPTAGGANSFNTNPSYTSLTDLHTPSVLCNNGVNLTAIVPNDIDGSARPTTPDIGADEATASVDNDMGVSAIITPAFPLIAGLQNVQVTLKNNGSNTITAADVNFTLNGGAPVTEAWTGSLAPCASVNYTFTAQVNIVGGTNIFKVYTNNVNGNVPSADPNAANDTAQFNLCAAMSGAYTIDPVGSGPTNFTSFTAAVNNLVCGGVSGPVTLNVANGTYGTQISIPTIIGASTANTITFTGTSAPACTLTASIASNGVVDLNGADYVSFNNMTIANTSASGYGVRFRNSADFNTVNNCIINLPVGSTGSYGIYQNNSTDINGTLTNNTFNNGYAGIFLQSNTGTKSRRWNITGNTINNTYQYGAYLYYHDSINFSSNVLNINSTISSSYGIYTAILGGTVNINKNKVYVQNGGYGLYLYTNGVSSLTRSLISNNFLAVGGTAATSYGMYVVSGTNYADIMNNSVNMTNSVTNGSYALYMSASSFVGDTIRNNIFMNTGNGTATGAGYAVFTYPGSSTQFTNNIYFTNNTSSFGMHNGTTYGTYASWKTAIGATVDLNPINSPIAFTSASDLHTNTVCANNTGHSTFGKVTQDIDNTARVIPFDIGADEFTAPAFDVALVSFVSPTAALPKTGGASEPVTVRVRNNGSTTVTSLDMNYSLNGGAPVSQTFTGLSLAPCAETNLTFTTNVTYTSGGTNAIMAYNGLINSSNADANNTNDTLRQNFCTSYNGTYTINKNAPISATNFSSFTQAAAALYSCGVSGPVTINVTPGSGPYNERLLLVGAIPGATATNRVTFNGGATKETITFAATSTTDAATVKMWAVKHVTLRNLTINSTSTTIAAVGVQLSNNANATTPADSNTITNCVVNVPGYVSTTNSCGICAFASNSTATTTTTGNYANKTLIDSNIVSGGYGGITLIGNATYPNYSKRNVISNNKLYGQFQYGMYPYYQDSMLITGNTIDSQATNYTTTGYALYTYFCDHTNITKNYIRHAGYYGMYLQYLNYNNNLPTTDRVLVANNMIIQSSTINNFGYGLYFVTAGKNIDAYHNSVSLHGMTGGYSLYMSGTFTACSMLNNSFYFNGAHTSYVNYIGGNYFTGTGDFNYNNIYSNQPTTTPLIYYGGTGTTFTAANWRPSMAGFTTSGGNSLDPSYVNYTSDLHAQGPNLDGKGVVTSVTTDYDGATRNVTTPDIGADEFTPPVDDAGVNAILTPTNPITAGLTDVTVRWKNYGVSTIVTVDVKYKLGVNGTVQTQSLNSISIAPGATMNVTFTGGQQANLGGVADTIIAWTELPNGAADILNTNDTTKFIGCAPMTAGTYTMNPALPASATNFTSMTDVFGKMMNCGIAGPIVVNVASGTYTGQYNLGTVSGTSATNTITIQSAANNADSVVLQYNAATTQNDNHVVYLSNIDYIKFRKMKFASSNPTYCRVIRNVNGPTNTNASYARFDTCIFQGSVQVANNQMSSSSEAAARDVLVTDIAAGTNPTDDYFILNGCTFINGGTGFYTTHPPSYQTGRRVLNSTFINQYTNAVYAYWQYDFDCQNNTITTNITNPSYYGLYFQGFSTGGGYNNIVNVIKNRLYDIPAGYGIYLGSITRPDVNSGFFLNNSVQIGTGANSVPYGIFLQNCYGFNVYHNTVNVTTSNNASYAAYIYNASTPRMDVKANIFSNEGNSGSAGRAIYHYNAGNAALYLPLDSNVYYVGPGAIGFANNNGTLYANIAAWRTGLSNTVDMYSIQTNPGFVASNNLHIANAFANVLNVNSRSLVTDDIDGQTRCGITDAGADHHTSGADAAMDAIVYPNAGVASLGLQTIKVRIKNNSSTPLTAANVSYNINGTVVTQAWTGSLGQCDTATVTFATQYNFAGGAFTMQAYIDSISPVKNNDTLSTNGCIGLSGNYTIDAAGSGPLNFTTFTAAVNAMSSCGIAGPVNFTVAAGAYNERLNIPVISGSSSINTITFTGVNKNTTILKYYTTVGNEYVVRINGSSNINFRNLSILSTNPLVVWNVHVFNGTNVNLTNCIIGDSANNYYNVMVNTGARIVVNGSTSSFTGAYHTGAPVVTIDSCTLHSAYYGICNYVNNGNSVLTFKNSYIQDNMYMSIYSPSSGCLKIKDNIFRNQVRTTLYYQYGIYTGGTVSSPNFTEITGNKFDTLYGYYYNYIFSNGSSTYPNILANNTYRGMGLQAGVTPYLTYVSATNWKVQHNTFNYDFASNTTSYALYMFGSGHDVRNNIFANTSAIATSMYPVYLGGATVASNFDYNLFYNAASSNVLNLAGTPYNTSTFKVAYPGGAGANSVYGNPNFLSVTDLHVNPSLACIASAPNVGINVDLDGTTRPATTVMGAYHVTKVTNDLGIDSLLVPAASNITPGAQDVKVRIINTGSAAATSGNVNLVLNGAAPVTIGLPATLASCDTVTITFSAVNFLAGFNSLQIYTSSPNGTADGNTANDTFTRTYCSPISGTFTINKNIAASGTNFTSINSAVSAIYSCGINGAVVFNITSGTGPYNEQVLFNGLVPGSSPTNTITINGGATKETVQLAGPSNASQHIFRLVGTKWVTLKNMTIKTLSPNWGIGVHLCYNSATFTPSDSNTVDSNIIILTGTTDSRNAGIAISTNTTFPTGTGNNGNYNLISNNSITNGYYGITCMGAGLGSEAKSNYLINNTINTPYYYGLYVYYQDSNRVNNNNINMVGAANPSSYGMYCYDWNRFQMKGNKVNNAGIAGVYFASYTNYRNGAVSTGLADRAEISNNMIGGNFFGTGTVYGMYFSSTYCKNVDIWHNTISVSTPAIQSSYGLFMQYSTNGYYDSIDLRNNSVSVFNSSLYSAYLYNGTGFTPASMFTNCNYNNFYNSDASIAHVVIGTTTYTQNNWIGVNGINGNSVWLNPNFNNNLTDLHTIHPNLNAIATPLASVTTDIDGNPRNGTTPDIGADEFTPSNENTGVTAITAPGYPLVPGLQNVVVNFKNFGTVAVTGVTLKYKVGINGTPKDSTWAGSLAPGATTTFTFAGTKKHNFTGTQDTIYAWTELPNGVPDGYPTNDSANTIICAPLNGTYTVNSGGATAGTNFNNFNDLSVRLATCGVSGPVTVNVATGTYTEQVTFTAVNGASATNRITIKSATGNKSDVTWQYLTASSANDNFVVRMNGADYFTFRDMTFNTSSNILWATIFNFQNVASNNQIINNNLNGNSAQISSTNQALIFFVNPTGSFGDDSIVISKNVMTSGTYGIYATPATPVRYNWVIDSNILNDVYYMGMYIGNQRNSQITRNIYTNNTGYTGSYGFYLVNNQSLAGGNFVIAKNRISGVVGNYGIYMASNTATNPAYPILFMNNTIQVGNGTSGFTYGLYSASNAGVRFYNNSFNSTNTNASYYTCYFTGTSTPANEVKHNIIANSGNGTTAGNAAYYSSNNTLYWQADSNVYYVGTGASGYGYAGSGTATTWTQWQTFANPNDQNSITTNPLFVSNTNLHTTSVPNLLTINPYGVVTDDMDGQARCSISDVGADHHPVTNDAGVSAISYPAAGIAAAGLQTIKVVLRNYGSANLTSANVSYNINGTVVTQAWTGNVAPCDTTTVVFSTQYNFSGGSFIMKAYTDLPNTAADPNVDNDTLYTSGCIGLSGVYTIDKTLPNGVGGNYSSFKNAINAMSLCGIGGPVTFNVAAGNYYEQIDIPVIVGQSATNTITFDGGTTLGVSNAQTRVLSFRVTNAAAPYVVRINNNSYITFRNLSINNSATPVVAGMSNVYLFNSNNIRISNCILGDSVVPASLASASVLYRVAVTGHITSPTTTPTVVSDNIFIDSCVLQYGYYGVFANVNDGTDKIYVNKCVFDRPYLSAVYFQGGASVAKITGNYINSRVSGVFTSGNYGIYVTNTPAVTEFNDISGNTIDSCTGYAIYNTSSGSVSNYNRMSNNMIYGFTNGSYYGIYNTGSFWKIYHNSIAYDFAGVSSNACYAQLGGSANSIDVRNNIFAVTNAALTGAVPFYTASATYLSNLDYNIYWNVASANLVRVGASNITTANYQNAFPIGGGLNARNVDPSFLSATNLHLPTSLGCTIAGGPGLGISTDIDGQSRSALAPIIGADEIVRLNNDLTIESIVSPATSQANAGSNTIIVVVKNVGQNSVTAADMNFTVNGGAATTTSMGAINIAPCDTASFAITGVTFINGTNLFKAYTTNPNGSADANPSNDTITRTFCTPLNGTYTVGGASPDYATIAAAVSALNCGGVTGPVRFFIRAGSYNEANEITKIIGSSATNTVTFQTDTVGGMAIVTRTTSTPSYVFKLNNADNVIFRNLDINSSLNVNPIQIIPSTDTCENIQIRNCKLSTGLTTSSTAYAAILTLGKVNNLKIVGNTISRGYGLYIQGNNFIGAYTPGIEIDSNRFDSSVGGSYPYKPITVQWASVPKIRYNTFNRALTGGGSGATQDISLVNISGAGEFSYNRVSMTASIAGLSPVYLNTVNMSGETTPFTIYNNYFYISNTSSSINALRIDNSNYVNVYHNTFNFINTTSPTTCRNIYTSSNGFNANVRIVNNIMKSSANLYSMQFQGSTAPVATAMIAECNNNNYFQGTGLPSENILSINGVLYTSTTMKGAVYTAPANNDLNSVYGDPAFISATDMRLTPASAADGKAKVIGTITNDFFGNARKMTATLADIGAQDTMFIRFTAGDYVAASGCVNISGSSWINVYDSLGKLVFAINPEGNNLGPTCWGIRINSGAVRTDSIYNSADGLKYKSYFLDRNFYINPTNQPAPGTAVSVRMYLKGTEWAALGAIATSEGKTLNAYYLKVHRYHEATPTTSLFPLTGQPAAGDSSHFLYTLGVGDYGSDKSVLFRTNHFSQFNPTFVSNVIPYLLPVTWLDFTAKAVDRNSNLDWSTASEKNSAMFVVERSTDGNEFEAIGTQKAAGNSASVKYYSFIDKNAAGLGFDKLYYRIKQIDQDGNFDYSKVRAVSFTALDDILVNHIGPNPFRNELHVDFDLPVADKVVMSLFDVSGQVVKSMEFNGVKGNNAHTLKAADLATGVYFLKIVSGGYTYTEKVIKQD